MSQHASFMKQTRADIKRSLSDTGQELKEMTRIHLVGLSSNKKNIMCEDEEIYYGQLSDDLDHEQIQAPFMQGQGFEKPKLKSKIDEDKSRMSLQKLTSKIKIDVGGTNNKDFARKSNASNTNPYVSMNKKYSLTKNKNQLFKSP